MWFIRYNFHLLVECYHLYVCFLIRLILFKKEFEILRTHVEIDLEIKSHY